MKNITLKSLLILLLLFSLKVCYTQSYIFSENFEGITPPNLPASWLTTTLGTDVGFYTGNSDSAQVGTFWLVKDHTSFAMSNDDVCGCDKSNDYLIIPTIDLTGYRDSTIFLKFDAWMENFWGGIGSIKVDTGLGWIDIYTIEPKADWQTRIIDLSVFGGASSISIAFHYNDEAQAGLGLAVDNVSLYVPSNQYDAAIYSTTNTYSEYTQIPFSQLIPIKLSSTVYNNGKDTLFDVKLIAQSSQTGFIDTSFIGTLNPAEYVSTSFSNNWMVSASGLVSVDYVIIHNNIDDFLGNNTATDVLQISDSILAKEDGVITDAQILFNGETIAQTFRIFKKDTLTSVSINLLLASSTDSIKFLIYKMNSGFPDNVIDSSQSFSSLSSGWSTHYFSNGIELDTGYYAVGMRKMGEGLTGLSASKNYYLPNTTFTSRFLLVAYFWYWDEQAYGGTMADHHTYLIRPNFGNENGTVGINNSIHSENQLVVYPNPSKGVVNILTNDKIEAIYIYDVSGKLVFQEKNSLNTRFDCSFLERGLYFGEVKTHSKAISFKLIME